MIARAFTAVAALWIATACSFPEHTFDDDLYYGRDGGGSGGVGGATGGAGGASGGSAGAGGATGGAGGAAGGSGGATGGTGGGTGGTGGAAGGTGGTGGATGGTGGGTGGSGGTGGGATCSPPSGSVCDVYPQCNCTGSLRCEIANETGATVCVSAGSIAPYASCDANPAGCQKGYTCVGTATGMQCKEYCDPADGCGSNLARDCSPVNGSGGSPIPGFYVCSAGCVLNDTASCGAGLACVVNGSTANGVATDCFASTGTGVGAGQCPTSALECAPGFGCDSNNNCHRWCRLDDPTKCSGCQGVGVTANGVDFGFCP